MISAFLKNKKVKVTIFSVCIIIIGLLLCIMPIKFLDIIKIVLSILMIVYGLINLFGYCFSPTFLRSPEMLIESIALIVAGFLIDLVSSFFVLVLGLIILLFGAKRVYSAILLKNSGVKNWWIDFIIGVIITLLGLLIAILCETKIVQSAVIILLGASLIFDGIICLVLMFVLHRETSVTKKPSKEEIEITGEVIK